MEKNAFLGIDVSKSTLDAALYDPSLQKPAQGMLTRVSNNESGWEKLLVWLRKKVSDLNGLAVCMENTGRYSKGVLAFLLNAGIDSREESPMLLRTKGIRRGKDDRIDAWGIARHCYTLRDEFVPTSLPSKALERLKSLQAERKRLVRERALYKAQEKDGLLLTEGQKRRCRHMIEDLTEAIKDVENEMDGIIASEERLKRHYDLITGVKGIGRVCATFIICATNDFTRIRTARKMACYAGMAPLPYQSGTSVYCRPRVSHVAAVQIKAEFSQAALNAIRTDPWMKQYFERKRKEGKSYGCVMNAVKCKLIARIYAVIKRDKPYVDIFGYAA